jgi:GNAT superfamily N-acetyltransferase
MSTTSLPAHAVDDALVRACAELFSVNYGVWSAAAPPPLTPGARVRYSPSRFRHELLFDGACWLVTAREDDQLVGHATYRRFEFGGSPAVWVTQLVVSATHRSRGWARRLLSACFTRDVAFVCLVSSHPHAVNALQRATGRICTQQIAQTHASGIVAASGVPYLQGNPLLLTGHRCVIQNGFFVDHAYVDEQLSSLGGTWQLGPLGEGEEFIAIADLRPRPVVDVSAGSLLAHVEQRGEAISLLDVTALAIVLVWKVLQARARR